MTILGELREGFANELDRAVPDIAIALASEGGPTSWGSKKSNMTNEFMRMYGDRLVGAALTGLNDDRIALLFSQEYSKIKELQVVCTASNAETWTRAAIKELFVNTVREVIAERLEKWNQGRVNSEADMVAS